MAISSPPGEHEPVALAGSEIVSTAGHVGLSLDESRLNRSVVALAWPVLVQQLALAMVQLVDTFLVGHLGSDALAGVGLATFIQWTPQAGVFALMAGTTAVLARAIGAGDQDEASTTMRQGLLLSVAWGLLTGVLILAGATWSMSAMGATGDALNFGAVWLRWAAPGMVALAPLFVANSSLQGAGDTRTPMSIMIAVNLVNGLAAFTLIHGSWMLPRMGVAGSGLGFSISQILGLALALTVLTKGRAGLRIDWRHTLAVDGVAMHRILKVGVPTCIEQLQFSVAMLAYTRIIASLGTTALAAHSVAIRIQSLAFMPGMAFGQAATAMMGQALGAAKPELARRAALSATRFALIILIGVGIVLALLGGPVSRIFIDDSDVTAVSRRILLIFAIAMPAIAVAFTLAGALRGAGDTRAVMLYFTVSPWIMRVGLAYLFAVVLGWGIEGAWLGAVLDMWTRGALCAFRFRGGRWQTIRV